MRISGTEPSSVILSQTWSIKSREVMTKKYQTKLKTYSFMHKKIVTICSPNNNLHLVCIQYIVKKLSRVFFY